MGEGMGKWGENGGNGEKWGFGETGVFTQSPLIPKPKGDGNTLGVNKASNFSWSRRPAVVGPFSLSDFIATSAATS
jgi:hypothetical protein